jgi:uroporphyrinogen III methyltransferase/synthase
VEVSKLAVGKVYLVGAGPGHTDLITVRGLSCLRRADVVVYDRLVSRSLLAETRPECLRIYVGKEGRGRSAMEQEEISQLLVAKGLEGQLVCRLKGGDPFVFGRGGEEAETLRRAGVPFEVVPGVTAGVGALGYAGIPVTHRGIAGAVAFVTGHVAENSAGVDWAALAAASTTLVCYMGVGRLAEIRDRLIRHGRAPDTPAAAIHWGTRPEQKVVTATLADLPDRVKGLPQPALIVIGQVVALRKVLHWAEEQPLFGQRVLIPFAGEKGELVADSVREQGGEPWIFPRRPGGPHPHEVAILHQEIAEGGIHMALLSDLEAAGRVAQALGVGALRQVRCVCMLSGKDEGEWEPTKMFQR